MRIRTRKVLFVAALISLTSAADAQLTSAALEAAAIGAFDSVPSNQVPANATFYSWQLYWQPPLPSDRFPDLTVYDLGGGRYLIDDRLVEYPSVSPGTNAPVPGPMPGVQNPMSEAAYGCALWIKIDRSTNNRVLLTVHNTRQGQSYQVWSSTNLSTTNWVAETNLTGASGNFTQALIPMTNRPMAFFKVSETRDYSMDTNSTFTGLNFQDTQLPPPDTMGAVGPNHFIELLNGETTNSSSIAIYDKVGNLVAKTNILAFFRINTNYPSGNRLVDSRILYDHRSQCWVASTLDNQGSGQVILAVSTNAAPTNFATGWTRHLIQVNRANHSADFPTLGLDDNGIYLTVVQFTNNMNGGHTVIGIKKPEIYHGTLVTNRLESYPTNSLPVWTAQPVVNFDAVTTNAYSWLVAKGAPDLGTNYQGGALCYRRLQWTNGAVVWRDTNWVAAPNAGSTYRDYYDLDGTNVTVVPVPKTGILAPHSFTQGLGEPIDLHASGSRLAITVIRNGFLWTCHTVGLSGTNGVYLGNATGTNVDRSGIQWLRLEVDSDGGSLNYKAHGRVFHRGTTNAWYYYFPSLMVNCVGDIVIGFSGSSLTNYIGAFYTSRFANGLTLDAPELIRPGNSPYDGGSRWGDYSATTLDPTDDWSFWSVQQVGRGTNLTDWATVIARIRPTP